MTADCSTPVHICEFKNKLYRADQSSSKQ